MSIGSLPVVFESVVLHGADKPQCATPPVREAPGRRHWQHQAGAFHPIPRTGQAKSNSVCISCRLFWMGVPLMMTRILAGMASRCLRSCIRGFLILCPCAGGRASGDQGPCSCDPCTHSQRLSTGAGMHRASPLQWSMCPSRSVSYKTCSKLQCTPILEIGACRKCSCFW